MMTPILTTLGFVMHPDGERLYFAEQDDLHCLRLPKDLKLAPTKYDSPYHSDAPAKLRGELSEGMILAVSDGTRVVIVSPQTPVNPGLRVT